MRSLALLLLALLSFGWVVLATAWVSDDAMITLRVVENWTSGLGLRWNTADRAQAASHPSWLVLLAGARLLVGPGIAAPLLLGGGLTAVTVAVLARATGSPLPAALLLFALCTSTAFVDYSTSGLENPLAHLLLVVFAIAMLRARPAPIRLGGLAGLLLLTRMDLLPLLGPSLLLLVLSRSARGTPLWRWLAWTALGCTPLLAWIAFASLYYGTPLQMPAYSKALATGVPRAEFVVQGGVYLWHLLRTDPASVLLLAGGAAAGWRLPGAAAPALVAGLLLQLAYVVYVGGDFMAGRFCTPMLAVAALLLAERLRLGVPLRVTLPGLGLLWIALLFAGRLPALLLVPPAPAAAAPAQPDGIGDERAFYYPTAGLLAATRQPLQIGGYSALLRQQGQGPVVAIGYAIGAQGLLAGDLVHIVDPYLVDPLLARLPVQPGVRWRPGHVLRRIPEGYLESLAHGDNRIVHPGLARYWQALRTIVRAPVFDGQRLATLWSFWSGAFDQDLADYVATDYQRPPAVVVEVARWAPPPPDGTGWYHCEARVVLDGGLLLRFPAPQQGSVLQLSLDGGDQYWLAFRRVGRALGERTATGPLPAHGGLGSTTVALDASLQGFDEIIVRATAGADFVAAVAHAAVRP